MNTHSLQIRDPRESFIKKDKKAIPARLGHSESIRAIWHIYDVISPITFSKVREFLEKKGNSIKPLFVK